MHDSSPAADAQPFETPLLDGLSPEERSRLVAAFTCRTFPAGATIIRGDERCESFFVISSGSLNVFSSGGRRIATRGPGECLGEVSLLTGEPASATVTALTEAVLWVAPQTAIRPLLEEAPALARNLCRLLGRRLVTASRSAERGAITLLVPRADGIGIEFALSLAASVGHHLQDAVALLDLSPSTSTSTSTSTSRSEEHPHERLTVVRAGGLPPDRLAALIDTLAHRHRSVLIWAPEPPTQGVPGPDPAAVLLAGVDRKLVVVRYGARSCFGEGRRRSEGGAAPELVVLGAPEPRSLAMSEAIQRDTGFPVAMLLPEPPEAMFRPGGAPEWVLRHAESPFARAIGGLARRLIGKTVGLAFGAGAGRGHAHLGALRALERLGVRADFVAGTSIGAFVAGMVALPLPLHEMELSIQRVGGSIRRWTLPVYSLLAGSGLDRAIRAAVSPELQIEELSLPCAGVAADLLTGEVVVLRRGSAWLSARACSGIPGVFPPVRLDGRLLVDGAVASPVPCRVARAMGADVVIGISLEIAGTGCEAGEERDPLRGRGQERRDARGHRRPPSWPAALLRSIDLLQQALTEQCLQDADVPLRAFTPATSLTDFRGGPAFLEAGERAVDAARDRLRALLPWVGV